MSGEGAEPNVIEFRAVQKRFSNGRDVVTAIQDLSLTIRAREYTCILGRSGCGKSTAANLLLGLDRPTGGEIRVLGVNPAREFSRLRGRIGSIFQNDRLLPWRTALDNVRLPLEVLKLRESGVRLSAQGWLTRLGLDGFKDAYPHELSGGMRQRVALARALVADPDIVVADEVFAHLDEVTGERLRRDFHQLAKERGTTVLHITHSIDEALNLGDRILVLGKPGKLLADITDVSSRDRAAVRALILGHLQDAGTAKKHSDELSAPVARGRLVAESP
jgi:NitT/TauT family transport system ATP-binding protein